MRGLAWLPAHFYKDVFMLQSLDKQDLTNFLSTLDRAAKWHETFITQIFLFHKQTLIRRLEYSDRSCEHKNSQNKDSFRSNEADTFWSFLLDETLNADLWFYLSTCLVVCVYGFWFVYNNRTQTNHFLFPLHVAEEGKRPQVANLRCVDTPPLEHEGDRIGRARVWS